MPSLSYYNLYLDARSGPATYTALGTGLEITNDLIIGASQPSVFDLNVNDPLTTVDGNVEIRPNGTLRGSSNISRPITVAGDWDNNGTFAHNNGLVVFYPTTAGVVNAGDSAFSNVTVSGTGSVTVANNATTTNSFTISSTTAFTLNPGSTLAVGNSFTNQTDGTNTTWTGSVLHLYGGNQYEVNRNGDSDSYATLRVSGTAQPRLWGSDYAVVESVGGGSVYSMDHSETVGDLYIYGNYTNTSYADHWSYNTDFNGDSLGSPRQANVYIEDGSTVSYAANSLSVIGDPVASTTIQNQGIGTFDLSVWGSSSLTLQYATPRNLSTAGLSLSGTPAITDISNTDFLVQTNSGSALTVAGSVITQNPAKNFNLNGFNSGGGVTGAVNVSVTGSSVSSWRFTNEYGGLAGEAYDADGGDPGEIVWTDSAALITVSGSVYSDQGLTASAVCDGVTTNIRLVVAGLTSASTSCAAGTGVYSFSNVGFGPADSLIVYIDGESETAATVTTDPISNISNMDVYENRVIVRHESTDEVRIEDLAVWDSSVTATSHLMQ